MKVRFIGREKYTTGMTNISEPWKDIPAKDKFIYELRSDKNENLKSTIEVIDVAVEKNKLRHLDLIVKVINGINELNEKENIYDNLSEEEKDMMNKFKELYK